MEDPLDERLDRRDSENEDALAHSGVDEQMSQTRANLFCSHSRFNDGKTAKEEIVLLDVRYANMRLLVVLVGPLGMPLVAKQKGGRDAINPGHRL